MNRNPIIKRYVRKIRQRLCKRRWYKKNLDRTKEVYEKNREKKLDYNKEWYEKNREKKLDYGKEWRKNNKEKIKEYNLKRIDIDRKHNWKRKGLIGNFDEIYKRYEETTNCDLCCVFLEGIGSTKKCMDHSHTTGLFRNILCQSCNVKRREDNF